MIITIIKSFLLFIFAFFLFTRISNSDNTIIIPFILKCFISSFALSLLTLFCKHNLAILSYVVPLFFFWTILCCITTFQPKILLTYSLVCYCTVLMLYSISAAIWGLFTFFIFTELSQIIINIFTLLSCATTFIFLKLILRSKRFCNTVRYLIHNSIFNYIVILYILSILILTFEQVYNVKSIQVSFLSMILLIVLLFLINLWWRNKQTEFYIEKMRLLEVKNLRSTSADYESYISKLENENKRLGAIIHKDNRIVNAMADSVCNYLSTTTNNSVTDLEELHAKGISLSNEIDSIKTYRQELLGNGLLSISTIPLTKHSGIDAIISFMTKEARSYGIALKFHFDADFFTVKDTEISELDLVHLLSDLIENAIIATKNADEKCIELSFLLLKGTPAISISDSGVPFEIETFMKLGITEASTHTSEGGTGIGLIDIWSFKKKYHASLVIEELNTDTSIYSKRLSIQFDNKCNYLIITDRFKEIISHQTRSDLILTKQIHLMRI